jgi:hypothetical protein
MKKNLILAIIALLGAVQLNAQSVWGFVNYFNNPLYPIEGVTVKLYTMSDQLVATTTTDGNGYYVFNNVSGTQFKIRANANLPGYEANIVNANDILMFINGQIEFNTWQYIAADVDGNGVVNMNDYQFVAVNHYLFGEAFPAGAWQFGEAQIDLIINAGGGPSNLGGSRLGDTEGIFIPTGREGFNIFTQYDYTLSNIPTGSELIIPVELNTNGDVSAYGLALAYDPEVLSVVSVDAALGFGSYRLEEGLLRISSLGAGTREKQIVNIKVKVIGNVTGLKEPFTVLGESHLIDGLGNRSAAFTVRMPRIGNQSAEARIALFPNPANDITDIRLIDMPSGIYNLQVVGNAGQLVVNRQVLINNAGQQLSLPLESLSKGVYVIRASNSETGLSVSTRLVKM